MRSSDWVEVPVTEWINDSEEKFASSHGELTNREWLQIEKKRIMKEAPYSSPFIRIHPKYFDKDSHSRRCHKLIALYRFINRVELPGEKTNWIRGGAPLEFPQSCAPVGFTGRAAAGAAVQ